MGVLQMILMALGIVNQIIPVAAKAEKAFSGKKGSGKAKKKLVMDAAKGLIASSPLKEAEKKVLTEQVSLTVDNVVATSKLVNELKK